MHSIGEINQMDDIPLIILLSVILIIVGYAFVMYQPWAYHPNCAHCDVVWGNYINITPTQDTWSQSHWMNMIYWMWIIAWMCLISSYHGVIRTCMCIIWMDAMYWMGVLHWVSLTYWMNVIYWMWFIRYMRCKCDTWKTEGAGVERWGG